MRAFRGRRSWELLAKRGRGAGHHVPTRVNVRTLASYDQKVRNIQRILGHVPLRRLTSTHVETAFNQLFKEGHTTGGVRAIRAVFRTAMNEADKKDIIVKNVVASPMARRSRSATKIRSPSVRSGRCALKWATTA
jgi:hypothetical protein